MKRAGDGRKRACPLRVFVLLSACFLAPAAFSEGVAEDAEVVPSVAPGSYRSSLSITFAIPDSSRLLVGVDGAIPSELSLPLVLSVPGDSERTFAVETVLMPYDPRGAETVRSRFAWTIDRKPPAAPEHAERRAEGGRWATLRSGDGDTVHWRMYHPVYGSTASGEDETSASVYVPDGASLCAWSTDRAGNRGPSVSVEATAPRDDAFPIKIVSPVPGAWANAQPLVIDGAPGVEISYTTDGSDPSANGIPYREPMILSDPAIRAVRVFAVDGSGNEYSGSVVFAVEPRAALASGASPVRDLRVDAPLVSVGDFLEVLASPGAVCVPGDSIDADAASDRLVISSVRGVRRYQPMTVTDGSSRWRWVFVVGSSGGESASVSGTVPAAVPGSAPAGSRTDAPASERPRVSVLDWYFVDIAWNDPVYASLDGHAWFPCDEPVFVDRSVPHELDWYSGSWKNGEVQRLPLPAKPSLTGVPAQALTADPVFIACDGTPYEFRYEGGYFEPDLPSASSPSLGSGLLIEIPNGSETHFSLSFRAFLGGTDHGSLKASFDMDRKSPRAPSAGIPETLSYSRDPVVIAPTGEGMIQVSIDGEPFSREDGTFTLAGNPAKPVDYTVRMFAVDRAGNRSPTRERTVTVDLNALYVNPSATVSGARDGTPSAPFATLDGALAAMRGPSSWRIELAGDCELTASRSVKNDVSIDGNGHTIKVAPRASLSVARSSLSIRDCMIDFARSSGAQTLSGPEPLAFSRSSPIRLDGASLTLDKCSLTASLSLSGSFLYAKDSRVSMDSTTVSLFGPEYAILVDAAKSSLRFASCSLSVEAKDAVCASLAESRATISDSSLSVAAASAGRAVEAWTSTVAFSRVTIDRTASAGAAGAAGATNDDTAIWLDGSSRITEESGLVISGFKNPRGSERAKK